LNSIITQKAVAIIDRGLRIRNPICNENALASGQACVIPTYLDKSAPYLDPLAFNLEKCEDLRAFDTHVFGSTTYNRNIEVPRLPSTRAGRLPKFLP
jgi:hypothetical protein